MIISFKSKEKLKKEIIKEINEDNKKKEEMQLKNISSLPQHTMQEKKVNNSKEDIKEIQMKFLKLIIALAFMILLFLLLFIYGGSFNKTNTNVASENKIEEKENKEIKKKKKLSDLENGIIDISDDRLKPLYSLFAVNNYEYFLIDTTFLYKNDNTLVSKMTNEQLSYLLTKTEDFQELLKFEDNNRLHFCDKNNSVKIEENEIKDILKKRFNVDDVKISEINSAYYEDGKFITYLKFNNSSGFYNSSCFDKTLITPKVITQTLAYGATKKEDSIVIDLKTVFISDKGIFADSSLKNKIKNSIANGDNNMEYVKNGTPYEAIFKLNDQNEYYFYGIERVK